MATWTRVLFEVKAGFEAIAESRADEVNTENKFGGVNVGADTYAAFGAIGDDSYLFFITKRNWDGTLPGVTDQLDGVTFSQTEIPPLPGDVDLDIRELAILQQEVMRAERAVIDEWATANGYTLPTLADASNRQKQERIRRGLE